MTPKEKADELIKRFQPHVEDEYGNGLAHQKQCAIIAIDELIGDFHKPFDKPYSFEDLNEQLNNVLQVITTPHTISEYTKQMRQFWLEVKQELEKKL